MSNLNKKNVAQIIETTYEAAVRMTIAKCNTHMDFASDMQSAMNNGTAKMPRVEINNLNGQPQAVFKVDGKAVYTIDPIATDEAKADIQNVNVHDMIKYLDRFVIGQDAAKRACAMAMVRHIRRIYDESDDSVIVRKDNVLMNGPSGVGKSEIWRWLSVYTGITVIVVDCSRLTPAGYKGRNVSAVAKEIYMKCGKDLAEAENAVVVLDEFDKLAVSEFKQQVLNDLLTFVEGGTIEFSVSQGGEEMLLETESMMVVAAGAFEGIESLFETKAGIGFAAKSGHKPSREEVFTKHTIKALEAYGFNKQIIGRFPVRVALGALTEDMLVQIQRDTDNSVVKQWQKEFEAIPQGVELEATVAVMKYVAKRAIDAGTGARELKGEWYAILEDAYMACEMDETITHVKVRIAKGEPVIEYGQRQAKKENEEVVTLFNISDEAENANDFDDPLGIYAY